MMGMSLRVANEIYISLITFLSLMSLDCCNQFYASLRFWPKFLHPYERSLSIIIFVYVTCVFSGYSGAADITEYTL